MVEREQRTTQVYSMMTTLGGENFPLPLLDVNEFSEPGRLMRIAAGLQLNEHLYNLIVNIWNSEKLPFDWNIGIICPVHKKDDPMRLSPFVESEIDSYQCGLRGG
ncbi:hypothetical protein NPIL_682821 [Nephila pilipes]|uniref:Uncharacterized protein n=1 Tax=Nephila pilipes TaxID=299642 RepID=A0A8X6P2S4_NEPPI|nr:hypothetical protein NPIL_682821 [Nephila pilipes]